MHSTCITSWLVPVDQFTFSFWFSFYMNHSARLYAYGMKRILIYMTCHLDQSCFVSCKSWREKDKLHFKTVPTSGISIPMPTATALIKSLILSPLQHNVFNIMSLFSTIRFSIEICKLTYDFSVKEECIQIYNSSHFPTEFTYNKDLIIESHFFFTRFIIQPNSSLNVHLACEHLWKYIV